PPPQISTLSLHDALPIFSLLPSGAVQQRNGAEARVQSRAGRLSPTPPVDLGLTPPSASPCAIKRDELSPRRPRRPPGPADPCPTPPRPRPKRPPRLGVVDCPHVYGWQRPGVMSDGSRCCSLVRACATLGLTRPRNGVSVH